MARLVCHTKSAEGLQGVSNVVFHGHGFHWGGWPDLSLAALPSTELKNPVYSFRAESTRWPPIWRSTGFEPRTSGIAVLRANKQRAREGDVDVKMPVAD